MVQKGDVVQHSANGLKYLTPQKPDRLGVCTGVSPSGQCVNVRWIGTNTAYLYHREFIKRTPIIILKHFYPF